MTIDISECKKYWACRKSCEPIDEFVSIRDINMLIGYVEQLQAELEIHQATIRNLQATFEPQQIDNFMEEWQEFLGVCKPDDSSFNKALRIIKQLQAGIEWLRETTRSWRSVAEKLEREKQDLLAENNQLKKGNEKLTTAIKTTIDFLRKGG